MSKIVYLKPSGTELEVNDDEFTREYAIKNGWKEVKPEAKRKPKQKDDKKEEPKQLDKLI